MSRVRRTVLFPPPSSVDQILDRPQVTYTHPPMRRLLVLIVVLLAAHIALLFVQPRGAVAESDVAAVDVGIVFDVGGRGDKSFNDGAYKGADSAKAVLGADIRFIEPGEGSDREAGLRLLAAQGMDLVIGVGFIFTDDLSDLAVEYPAVKFAGVDYAVTVDAQGNVVQPPSNLAALKFREEEGSFLVGAIAVPIALATRSNPLNRPRRLFG